MRIALNTRTFFKKLKNLANVATLGKFSLTLLYSFSSLAIVRNLFMLTPFSRRSLTKSTRSFSKASCIALSKAPGGHSWPEMGAQQLKKGSKIDAVSLVTFCNLGVQKGEKCDTLVSGFHCNYAARRQESICPAVTASAASEEGEEEGRKEKGNFP